MPDHDQNSEPFNIPPLHEVEEEGRQAAEELAHDILRASLEGNGRLDMTRLGRAGPMVQSIYIRLLSSMIALPTGPQGTAKTGVAARRLTALPPAAPNEGAPPLPRTELGWRGQQCRATGFADTAFYVGAITSMVLGFIVVMAAHFFHL